MSKASDEAMMKFCEALAPEIMGQHEFELALGTLVAKHRRMLRMSLEYQAAQTLQLGVAIIAERQGCHRVTAYRRAKRGQKLVARLSSDATGGT